MSSWTDDAMHYIKQAIASGMEVQLYTDTSGKYICHFHDRNSTDQIFGNGEFLYDAIVDAFNKWEEVTDAA